MSILIKGMEMPIFEHQSWDIHKGTDGKWYMVDNNAETSDGAWHEIVPVPAHGRCIDAGALMKRIKEEANNQAEFFAYKYHPVVIAYADCYGKCSTAPTIIPAEEGE